MKPQKSELQFGNHVYMNTNNNPTKEHIAQDQVV